MKEALAALLSSKKFLTAIVGVVVAVGAKYGLALDPEIVASLIGMFAILIGAQGAADHGKEAAKVTAGGSTNAVPVDVAAEVTPVKPSRMPSGPIASGILITLLGVLALVMVMLAGCGPTGRAIGRTTLGAVDCLTPAAASAISQYGPAVAAVLRNSTMDDGTVDWRPLRAVAERLKTPAARCVLAAVVDEALRPRSPDPDAPQAEAQLINAASLAYGFDEIRAELFDGATFQLEGGRTL